MVALKTGTVIPRFTVTSVVNQDFTSSVDNS